MNTDEFDSTSTTNADGNKTSKKKTSKTNQKFIAKSINAKIFKELNSTSNSTTAKTISDKTTKRLNTTKQRQQQANTQINKGYSNQKIQKTATTTTSTILLQNITSTSLTAPSLLSTSLTTVSKVATLSTFSSTTLASSAFERISNSSENINFTNLNLANKLNLLTTREMPTRTKTITELNSTLLSTETSSTNVINSTLRSTLINPTNEMSTKSKIRFRRSYSVPILKIDEATRARIYAIKANELSCDKNFSINDANQLQQQKQKHEQEKLLNDESASVETSSKSTIKTPIRATKTVKKITTTTQTPTTTTTTTLTARATQLRRPVSKSMRNDDLVDHDDDNDNHVIASDDHDNIGQHHIREDLRFGCAHYKRRAMFVTPCCNKFYKCRFCHDENESHHFDRKTLNELICSECNTRQKVQEACVKCGVRFGKYTCLVCNLFDDEDKKQYHCDACGICRIGGAENFFHCEVCNMCLPIQLKIDGHKCVENISRSHCPVCLGDIHTSRIPCHIPDCGHLLHKMCFDQLLASGHYACPTCQTSLIDMTALWDFLDAQASQMPMPKKYENSKIHIFCNDCQRTSKANFHFIGLKCMECGAYNTTQDVKRRVSLVPDETNTA